MLTTPNLALTLKKRLLLLLCIFLVCFLIVSVISTLVTLKFGMTTAAVRIVTILQDLVLFMTPALITAMLVTRLPATLLCIDKKPKLVPTAIGLCVMLVATPAMDLIIALNQAMPLPESIESTLAEMEHNAQAMVDALCGAQTLPNLLMSILIVGVLAGLSEELLFRGALQRLLVTGHINHHKAIWATAFVFSALHMQIYGFVPRMLLGAYFGYALYWTGSLWVPVILHIFNNSLYLIVNWYGHGEETSALDLSASSLVMACASAILTVVGLVVLRRFSNQKLGIPKI